MALSKCFYTVLIKISGAMRHRLYSGETRFCSHRSHFRYLFYILLLGNAVYRMGSRFIITRKFHDLPFHLNCVAKANIGHLVASLLVDVSEPFLRDQHPVSHGKGVLLSIQLDDIATEALKSHLKLASAEPDVSSSGKQCTNSSKEGDAMDWLGDFEDELITYHCPICRRIGLHWRHQKSITKASILCLQIVYPGNTPNVRLIWMRGNSLRSRRNPSCRAGVETAEDWEEDTNECLVTPSKVLYSESRVYIRHGTLGTRYENGKKT